MADAGEGRGLEQRLDAHLKRQSPSAAEQSAPPALKTEAIGEPSAEEALAQAARRIETVGDREFWRASGERASEDDRPWPLARLHHLSDTEDLLDDARRIFVKEAREAGATWEQVGGALRMTRQAAWERYREVEGSYAVQEAETSAKPGRSRPALSTEARSQSMETPLLDGYADGLRAGDPDALAGCYEVLREPLRRWLLGQCRNRALAEDLVMATFEELLRNGHRIRGGGDAIRAWVFTAARNNLYDERRKRHQRGDLALPEEAAERLEMPGLGTEDEALNNVGDRRLQAALDKLSEDQREVLSLRFAAGLSGPETAEVTGRSLNAVKTLQHRALTALSKHLRQDE